MRHGETWISPDGIEYTCAFHNGEIGMYSFDPRAPIGIIFGSTAEFHRWGWQKAYEPPKEKVPVPGELWSFCVVGRGWVFLDKKGKRMVFIVDKGNTVSLSKLVPKKRLYPE